MGWIWPASCGLLTPILQFLRRLPRAVEPQLPPQVALLLLFLLSWIGVGTPSSLELLGISNKTNYLSPIPLHRTCFRGNQDAKAGQCYLIHIMAGRWHREVQAWCESQMLFCSSVVNDFAPLCLVSFTSNISVNYHRTYCKVLSWTSYANLCKSVECLVPCMSIL